MLPEQCRRAREILGWSMRDLAAAAQVSLDTVARLERGERLLARTLAAISSSVEAAGVEFTNDAPGTRFKRIAR